MTLKERENNLLHKLNSFSYWLHLLDCDGTNNRDLLVLMVMNNQNDCIPKQITHRNLR
jgi:hypothetical protein